MNDLHSAALQDSATGMEREIMRYLRKKDGRRGSGIRVAAGLLCLFLLVLLPAKEVLAVEGTVTSSSANIRAGADPNSQILASVLNGDKLSIKEEVTGTDGNVWFYVFIDSDRLGYVRSDLVKKDDGSAPSATTTFTPPSTPTPTPTPPSSSGDSGSKINQNVVVNRDGAESVQPISASVNSTKPVRVRADSSTDSEVVTNVKQNVVLTVHGTKTAGNGDVWYLVSFMVDNTEVNGYIHSEYVTLGGELQPVEPEVPDEPNEPVEPEPVEPAPPTQDWYTMQKEDGTWILVENATGNGTPIASMFKSWNDAVDELEAALGKVSRQTVIIVILSVLLVLLALGVTLLVFKIKDMAEDDGFDTRRQQMPMRRSGDSRQARSSGSSQTRPAGSRPAGTRPVPSGSRAGAERPDGRAGARPAAGTQGGRPAGARPEGTRPASAAQGNRPAGAARPEGARPAQPAGARPAAGVPGSRPAGTARPEGARPAQPAGARPAARPQEGRQGVSTTGDRVERQARANVEARNLERGAMGTQPKKARNFMSDDDEFEFEFLNWDGDGEA